MGRVLPTPRLGAVVVLSRERDPGAGHVGFWTGETADKHILLGGNQSDAVTVAAFAKDGQLGFRWPLGLDGTEAATDDRGAVLMFDGALAHLLEMERGFTDEPDDPGGPINKGGILEVLCRHVGRVLNEFERANRVSELRAISDDVVQEIYRKRYGSPSRADEMTPAIAFMHFDASVDHGLTGDARLLKRQRNDLEIDGEMGPGTLAAARETNETQLLAAYADARRTKYRSLRHFWKFGRGWLNRVDRTESSARQLLGGAQSSKKTPPQPTKGNDMTNSIETTMSNKWWGSSITNWGPAIAALSTVVPILGPALGLEVTSGVVRQAGEQFVSVLQAIGGLAGTVMTIYGRTRATQKLKRRSMQLHL
jgi:lysozyme family protein